MPKTSERPRPRPLASASTRGVLLVAWLWLVPALAAAEADVPPPRYGELVEQALHESSEGRWAEARAIFREAHALYPNARTWRAIGIASYEIRDYVEAYRALTEALVDTRKPLTDVQRAEAEDVLGRVRTFVGRYTLEAFPGEATFVVDGVATQPMGARELVLPIGRHRVAVTSGERVLRGEWTVQGGESEPLPVREATAEPRALTVDDFGLPAAPPPEDAAVREARERARRLRRTGAAVAATGGALVVIGSVFLGLGVHDNDTVTNAPVGTPWSELQDAYDRGRRRSIVGITMLGVGAAAAGTGLYLVLRRERTSPTSTVRVAPNAVAWEARW
ncbi:MAG: hypothetical protein U0230_23725 [Polyangiales bacterium]